MKIFKILQVSVNISTNFLIISLASGGSAPEPPIDAYFQNFLYFSLNFRENYDKILKSFQKSVKICFKIFKKLKNFIAFLNLLNPFEYKKREIFYFSRVTKYPPPIAPGTPPPIGEILDILTVLSILTPVLIFEQPNSHLQNSRF